MVDIRGGIDLIKEVRLPSGLLPTNNRDLFFIRLSFPTLPAHISIVNKRIITK